MVLSIYQSFRFKLFVIDSGFHNVPRLQVIELKMITIPSSSSYYYTGNTSMVTFSLASLDIYFYCLFLIKRVKNADLKKYFLPGDKENSHWVGVRIAREEASMSYALGFASDNSRLCTCIQFFTAGGHMHYLLKIASSSNQYRIDYRIMETTRVMLIMSEVTLNCNCSFKLLPTHFTQFGTYYGKKEAMDK